MTRPEYPRVEALKKLVKKDPPPKFAKWKADIVADALSSEIDAAFERAHRREKGRL